MYAGDEMYADEITSGELEDWDRWMDYADDERKAREESRSEDYCDYCENDGHTFRTCPARDDDPESFV